MTRTAQVDRGSAPSSVQWNTTVQNQDPSSSGTRLKRLITSAALVISVEEVDGERLGHSDRRDQPGSQLVVGIAERSLPVAGVARGDVEVALLIAELPQWSVAPLGAVMQAMDPAVLGLLERVPGHDVVALEDGQPGSDVSQRDRQIDDITVDLDRRVAGANVEGPPVPEDHVLVGVLGARGGQDRAQTEEQCTLGDPGRAVGRAGRTEGRHAEEQGPYRGPELGDRRDVHTEE